MTIIPGVYEGLDPSPLLYERNMSTFIAMLTYHMTLITWLEPNEVDNTPDLS